MSYHAPATSLSPNQKKKPQKRSELKMEKRPGEREKKIERDRKKNQRELFQWLLKKNGENNCLFTNSHWMTSWAD